MDDKQNLIEEHGLEQGTPVETPVVQAEELPTAPEHIAQQEIEATQEPEVPADDPITPSAEIEPEPAVLEPEIVPLSTPEPHPHHLYKRFIIAGAIAGAGLSIAILSVFVVLQRQGSFNSVSVVGVAIRNDQSVQTQTTAVQKALTTQKFTVVNKDKKQTSYTASDVGISYDVAKTVTNARNQKQHGNIFKRMAWWDKQTVPLVYTVDQLKIDAFNDNQLTQAGEAPTNAMLKVVGENVQLTPDKPGKGYKVTDARAIIDAAAKAGQSTSLVMTAQDIPAVTMLKDVEPHKAQIEAAMNQQLTFVLKGQEYHPSKAIIGSWVIPINADSKTPDLLYDSGEIEAYLDKISAPYTSTAQAQIIVKQSDGSLSTVVPGNPGEDVLGKKDVAKQVASQLLDPSKPINFTLNVSESPLVSVMAESYDKWIIVDLTNKRMDAFEKSTLVKSFQVSAGAPATPTVVGQYQIYAKFASQDMRGYNANGTTYFQPHVQWINYFYKDYAIHGNYWRPDWYFGNVNSSHGCVGARNSDAEWIYDWAPVGTPVVTHL